MREATTPGQAADIRRDRIRGGEKPNRVVKLEEAERKRTTISFHDYSTNWLSRKKSKLALSTYANYKSILTLHIVSGYEMHHFIGTSSKLEKCVQNFRVDDGSGAIEASYAALCQMGPVLLKDGDQVTVEGHYLGTLDVKSVKKN